MHMHISHVLYEKHGVKSRQTGSRNWKRTYETRETPRNIDITIGRKARGGLFLIAWNPSPENIPNDQMPKSGREIRICRQASASQASAGQASAGQASAGQASAGQASANSNFPP